MRTSVEQKYLEQILRWIEEVRPVEQQQRREPGGRAGLQAPTACLMPFPALVLAPLALVSNARPYQEPSPHTMPAWLKLAAGEKTV